MKTAILHDSFDEFGGAELTVLILARGLDAEIITTNIDKKKIRSAGFGDLKIRSIGQVTSKKYKKQLEMKKLFRHLDISREFDLFIFGGFCSAYAAPKHKPNIWYCFSPQRGLYDLRYFYFPKWHPAQVAVEYFRSQDRKNIDHVQHIIAPSKNVKRRIKEFLGRESELNYSPVDTSRFKFQEPGDYWLCVTRITPYKQIELQLEAFKELKNEKLKIVGDIRDNPYFEELKQNRPKNVEFIGYVQDEEELIELYSKCRGFIVSSKNEDLGLNVVEAMASGKPVIAPKEGGYQETVVDGRTGVLIKDMTPEKLAKAVTKVGKEPVAYREACEKQAKKFDTEVFLKKFDETITSRIK